MNLIKSLSAISVAVLLVACETAPIDNTQQEVQVTTVTHESVWPENKEKLISKLRAESRLRVQDQNTESIYVQIRSARSFNVGGLKPTAELLSVLDEVATILEGENNIAIEVSGHTDSSGNPQSNLALSAQRAKVVADYLVSQGLTQSIAHVGYGAEKPIASNSTGEGRAVNRRIDILITNIGD